MNLDQQCVSLEVARKLKDLNVKQESQFYWYEGYNSWLLHYIDYNNWEEDHKIFIEHNSPCYSAFTVAELGEMLPERLDKNRNQYIKFQKTRCESTQKNHYLCSYIEDGGYHMDYVEHDCSDENEANARAKMLIHLLENNLMTLPDEIK